MGQAGLFGPDPWSNLPDTSRQAYNDLLSTLRQGGSQVVQNLMQKLGLSKMTPAQAIGMGQKGINPQASPAYPGRAPAGATPPRLTGNPDMMRILSLLEQQAGKISPNALPLFWFDFMNPEGPPQT